MTAAQYNKRTLDNEILSINFIHEKLLLIKEKFLTQTGKLLAEERHDFMLVYLKQFLNEYNLNILSE